MASFNIIAAEITFSHFSRTRFHSLSMAFVVFLVGAVLDIFMLSQTTLFTPPAPPSRTTIFLRTNFALTIKYLNIHLYERDEER